MFAVEACQISGGDTVIISHIRICIISDHGIRAALLSAGHMDRTFAYLNSGRIDPSSASSQSLSAETVTA